MVFMTQKNALHLSLKVRFSNSILTSEFHRFVFAEKKVLKSYYRKFLVYKQFVYICHLTKNL